MVFYFKSVLVDKVTGEIIGYEVESENNESVASITLEKAKELGVCDVDDLDYLDLPVNEVVSGRGRYALVDYADIYMASECNTPFEKLDDGRVCIYGYVFESYKLLEIDNEFAIKRLYFDKENV